MADLKRLYVELATNVRPLVAGTALAGQKLRDLGKDITKVGTDLDKMSAKAAAASKKQVEATLRLQAAQERVNRLREKGAQPGQQASALAALSAAERALTSATKAAADATEQQAGSNASLNSAAETSSNVLEKVALVGGGTLVAGLTAASVAALALEQRLYNVASISPDVAEHMQHYSQLITTLSTQLPQTANELAEGFYNIVSSGFAANDAIVVLEASATAAAAGLTSTETAGTAIAAVLNAYGLEAGQAADVSDVLFSTVQDGVISFEQLAQGIGEYIGTGAAAKVSIGELGAAVAAMTLSGVTAAESGTSLNTVLQSLIDPSDAMTKQLHALGYESGAQALEVDGLHGVMEKLRTATGGNVESLLQLFPQIRAARGAFALMAADGANYSKAFDDVASINGRVGATQAALAEQQKSGSYQITILKNEAVALGIQMGQTLLPMIKFVVGGMHDFLDMLNNLPGPIMAVATILAALSGAALLGVGAFIRFRAPIADFRTNMAAMRAEGSALPGVLRGTAVAAAGVTAALIIGTLVYGHYTAAKQKAKQATQDFVEALKAEAAGDREAFTNKVIKRLSDNGDLTVLQKWGVDYATYVRGITGNADDLARAREQLYAKVNDSDDVRKLTNDLTKESTAARASRVEYEALTSTQQDVTSTTQALGGPLADLANTTKVAADGTDQLDESTKALSSSLASLVDPVDAAKGALTSLSDPSKVFTDVSQKASEAAQQAASARKEALQEQQDAEVQAAQDAATAASRRATDAGKGEKDAARVRARAAQDHLTQIKRDNKAKLDALDDGATKQTASLSQYTKGLQQAAIDQAAWERDLTAVTKRAGVDVADALRAMGTEAVPLVHQIATGTQAEVDEVKKAFADLAPSAQQSLGAFTATLQKQLADQAAYAGNLVMLAAKGHQDLANLLSTMDPSQAAPLAAQALASKNKGQLTTLDRLAAQQSALAGGGNDALATNVQAAMTALEFASTKGGKAAADAFVQAFGGVDEARLYIDALKTSIDSIPVRKQLDIILNLLTPTPVTIGIPRQGHMNDSDFQGAGKPLAPMVVSGAGRLKGAGFADGKLPSDALIAGGSGMGLVQWAEGSTGGEAFIPLAPGKRQRSTRILGDVAHRFGMAVVPVGGMTSYAAGGITVPAHSSRGGQTFDSETVTRIALALSRLVPRIHQTEFSGPIYGLTLEQVQRAAEDQERVNNLGGL